MEVLRIVDEVAHEHRVAEPEVTAVDYIRRAVTHIRDARATSDRVDSHQAITEL